MAFYAHIASTQIFAHSPLYTVWTTREAFDESRSPWKLRFKGEVEQWIIGAAQFILWNGLELFEGICCSEMEEELQALEPGLLCSSENKLTRK